MSSVAYHDACTFAFRNVLIASSLFLVISLSIHSLYLKKMTLDIEANELSARLTDIENPEDPDVKNLVNRRDELQKESRSLRLREYFAKDNLNKVALGYEHINDELSLEIKNTLQRGPAEKLESVRTLLSKNKADIEKNERDIVELVESRMALTQDDLEIVLEQRQEIDDGKVSVYSIDVSFFYFIITAPLGLYMLLFSFRMQIERLHYVVRKMKSGQSEPHLFLVAYAFQKSGSRVASYDSIIVSLVMLLPLVASLYAIYLAHIIPNAASAMPAILNGITSGFILLESGKALYLLNEFT